jgi:hypothetical protein
VARGRRSSEATVVEKDGNGQMYGWISMNWLHDNCERLPLWLLSKVHLRWQARAMKEHFTASQRGAAEDERLD